MCVCTYKPKTNLIKLELLWHNALIIITTYIIAQTVVVWNNSTYYFTVSIDQNPVWLSCDSLLQGPSKVAVKIQRGLWSHLEVWQWKNLLSGLLLSHGYWQDALSCELLHRGSYFFVCRPNATFGSLPHGSLLVAANFVRAGKLGAQKVRERELRKNLVFYKPVLKVTFYHFFLTLLPTEASHVVWPTFKGRRLHKGVEIQRQACRCHQELRLMLSIISNIFFSNTVKNVLDLKMQSSERYSLFIIL